MPAAVRDGDVQTDERGGEPDADAVALFERLIAELLALAVDRAAVGERA